MIHPLADQGQGTPASFVARDFELEAVRGDETLRISALGLYRAFINGKRVGDDLLTPGWTCYDKRIAFQTYPVAGLLRPGANRIEIWLADGWYRSQIMWAAGGHLQLLGRQDRRRSPRSPRVTTVLVRTDARLEERPAADPAVGHLLRRDLRRPARRPAGDRRRRGAAFRHRPSGGAGVPSGSRACAVPGPGELDRPRRPDDLRLRPERGGLCRFKVRGAPGARVIVEHSEIVDRDREIDNRNYRSAEARIEYVLKGEGLEAYRPHFTFQGFRYARVTIEGDATVETIEFVPISSVSEATASFECGNPLVNRLVLNTLWSQRSNFIEVPTDCPQRDERLGWTGDAQVFAATACYLHDSHAFLRKYLREVMADQRPDGAIPHFSPDPTRLHPRARGDFAGSTGWGDAITVIPWVLWEHYGDREVLAETLPAMVRWVDFLWSISDGPIVRPPADLGRARLHLRRLAAAGRRQPQAGAEHRRRLRGDDLSLHLLRARGEGGGGRRRRGGAGGDGGAGGRGEARRSRRSSSPPSGRLGYNDQTSYALAFL